MPGRPKTTGRFDTREELESKILGLYYDTSCSMARIARNVEVSEATVNTIIETKPKPRR